MLYNDNYFCDRCGKIKLKNELTALECYPGKEVCRDCHAEVNKILFDMLLVMQIKGK